MQNIFILQTKLYSMEKFTDKDKLKHFTVNFAASLVLGLYGVALGIGLSLGKEYGDKGARGNHWCWKDLAADGVGIAMGYMIHKLIVYLINTAQ